MTRIGDRYVLDPEPVGRGGMGEVYRAVDERLGGRIVAVKKLAREMWGEERSLERLRREVELQAKIAEKRHVVEVYDVIEDGRHLYVAMEFVEGGRSLEDLMHEGPVGSDGSVSVEEAGRYFEQACLGLREIHRAGIVHGDIKSRNFLLTSTGVLKLGDFGLSRLSTDPVLTTRPWGTARTMAPEVYEGRMSEASDVYGMGFTFYELHVGKQAFGEAFKAQLEAANPAVAWMRWHTDAKRKAPAASSIANDVPEAMSELLSRAMDKDEAKRPDADELLNSVCVVRGRTSADLTRPLRAEQPAAPAASPGGSSRLTVAVLAILAVAVAALGWQVLSQRSETTPQVRKLQKDLEELRAERGKFREEVSEQLQDKKTDQERTKRLDELETAGRGHAATLTTLAERLRDFDPKQVDDRVAALEKRVSGQLEASLSAAKKSNQESDPQVVRRLKALEAFVAVVRGEREEAARVARLAKEKASAREAAAGGPEKWKVSDCDPAAGTEWRTVNYQGSSRRMPVEIVHGKTRIHLMLIEPGSYWRGASPGDNEAEVDEMPGHRVTLTEPLYLGKYEVTQGAWKRGLMGENPSQFQKGERYPVERVSWTDAVRFCERWGFRLPTEAEWEYACRAETPARRYGTLDDIAWYTDNSGSCTHEVGGKVANEWDLHDMLGNVYEWCADWYDAEEYARCRGGVKDPRGPDSGQYRVLRGGSWRFNPRDCRSSGRGRSHPTARDGFGGFRVARTP